MIPSNQVEMQVSPLDQERRLTTELSLKYRGTASIRVDALRFTYDKNGDDNHESNVNRLKTMFSKMKITNI